jgi:hypothetical protein
MSVLTVFLAGANTLGFLVAALLFLRAWSRTADWLFAAFSAAFALLALNQFASTMESARGGEGALSYLLRLAAFATLIAAIVRKNLGSGVRRS